eukprot:TRINITY_DN16335_c0_g1_i1.p1 TRINITY_DN16335_c0_g1~~TRINITY_DN16335_c0_g1_i1.p1  ORF type:complete len:595 (+),score=100.63 TRINITY_DN16335_c0_g1_i1:41-1825(+)
MSGNALAEAQSLLDALQNQSDNRMRTLQTGSGVGIPPRRARTEPGSAKGHVTFKVDHTVSGEEEIIDLLRELCDNDQVTFSNALKLWVDTEAPLELQRNLKLRFAEPTLLHHIPYAPGQEVVPPFEITKHALPTMVIPNPYYSLQNQAETKKKTKALLLAIEQENERLANAEEQASNRSEVVPFEIDSTAPDDVKVQQVVSQEETKREPVREPIKVAAVDPVPVPVPAPLPEPAAAPVVPAVVPQVQVDPPVAAAPVPRASSKAGQRAREKKAVIERFYENMEKDGMGPDTSPPGRYEIIKGLGRGSQGVVKHMRNKETGLQFARKIIGIDSRHVDSVPGAKQLCDRIRTEIAFTRLDCQYLLRSQAVFADVATHTVSIDTPIMHCDLGVLVSSYNKPVPEDIVSRIMFQVVSALAFLHSKDKPGSTVGQVFHRDLKPDNILMDFDGTAKVSDFGVAKGVTSTPDVHTKIGNQLYSSPESMRHDSPFFSFGTDVWSAGMIAFHMLNGSYPLAHDNIADLYQFLAVFDWADRTGNWSPPKASSVALAFLSRTLVHDPTLRATANQLLDDPFMLKGKDISDSVVKVWMDAIKPLPT